MEEHARRYKTGVRHWRAILHGGARHCELCDAPATNWSSLVDENDFVREVHWYCKLHLPKSDEDLFQSDDDVSEEQ